MLIVKDVKKIKIIFALAYFAFAVFLFDFFLSNTKTNGVWEWLFASVVFFLIGPLVLIKFAFKEEIKQHFLSFSFKKQSLLLSFAALLLYIFTIFIFVVYLDWKKYLSVSSWTLGGVDFLVFINLILAPFVLFSREFFFRGYFLKTLLASFGIATALICQSLLNIFFDSYLSGFSLAWQQMTLLFFLYFFLGFVAWMNKSVFLSFFLSWVHLLIMDIFFIYQITRSIG